MVAQKTQEHVQMFDATAGGSRNHHRASLAQPEIF
jgi:hypothetical protein